MWAWEGGLAYPKAEHLKAFIALGVRAPAFPAGQEAEQIRTLWKAAYQKVLLDEDWLLARAERGVYALAWSPAPAELLSGDSDGQLCWWDLHHGERVREREAHQGTVQALKVSPDGHRLASCGDDGAIRLWDLERGEPRGTLRRDRPYERLIITGIRGLTEAQRATLLALGAIENPSSTR